MATRAKPELDEFLRKMRQSQEREEEETTEELAEECQSPAVSGSELPQQAIVYSPNFKPLRGQVYNDAMRRLLRGVSGDAGELLCRPDKNDLVFRKRFVNKRMSFNADCNRMRRAAALQMVGIMQKKQCDHCKKGLGPFRGCVVLTGFARGACANCRYSSIQLTCNYHCYST